MDRTPGPRLVISGGQTGVDTGALVAAHQSGIPTGGWAPMGWLREGGPAPWLAEWGLREHESSDYPQRTEANVRDSDVTIWLGPGDSAGYWCTRKAAERLGKPFWEVGKDQSSIQTPKDLALFLRRDGFKVLNFAGSRESNQPSIQQRTERFLRAVFEILQREASLNE